MEDVIGVDGSVLNDTKMHMSKKQDTIDGDVAMKINSLLDTPKRANNHLNNLHFLVLEVQLLSFTFPSAYDYQEFELSNAFLCVSSVGF